MTDTRTRGAAWPVIPGEIPPFFDHPDRACAGKKTKLFFPENGDLGRAAVAVCRTCPLVETCAEWAVNQPTNPHGVWGGLTRNERARIRNGTYDPAVTVRPEFRRPTGRQTPFATTAQTRAKIVALHDDGHSIGAIAERVGCSYRTVQRHLRAAGRTGGGRPGVEVAA
jgi:WhiB family redox-sensing transcriptional regulator